MGLKLLLLTCLALVADEEARSASAAVEAAGDAGEDDESSTDSLGEDNPDIATGEILIVCLFVSFYF